MQLDGPAVRSGMCYAVMYTMKECRRRRRRREIIVPLVQRTASRIDCG